MALFKVRTKKWGSSIGIVLPRHIVKNESIHPGDTVTISVLKPARAGEFFGALKGKIRKPTQKIMDDLRKELYD